MTYQIAQDSRSGSRLASRRIAELCNCWRNAEDEREDPLAGMSFDRNRLSTKPVDGRDPLTYGLREETSMKITAIKAWQVNLPLKEGRYTWSDGNSIEVFDSTVVAIETDEGVTGYAECCPLGSVYLPSYAAGVRAGLAEMGPHLIGADPLAIPPFCWTAGSFRSGSP
jgi:hypothetical protein